LRWTGAARRAAALAVGLWLAPALAHAGGFEVPDLGTVPIGRGAAFVARADTLDAYHYNPAGLSKLPGPNLLVVGNVVHLRNEFTRRGSGMDVLPPDNDGTLVNDPAVDPNTGEPWPTVRNGQRFGPAPMFVFSWGDVGTKGLALYLGVAPPSGFGGHSWSREGAQRYTIRKGDFFFLGTGVGLAYRVNRWFSFGATFLVGMFTAHFDVATRQGATGLNMNEDLAGDNDVEIEVRDLFVPSGQLGVLSQPLDWLELGASVRLPMRTRAQGSLKYTPNPDGNTPNSVLASASHVRLAQEFPTVVRAGARFVHRRFDIELDFVWENWRSLRQIDVEFSNPDCDFAPPTQFDDPCLLYLDTFGNGSAYTPIIATDVPLDFRDTYSVRLGTDVEVWPGHITLRTGGFWQSSAYPKNRSTYSIRFPFDQQIGFGGGITWHAIPQLDVSAGYLHIFQRDVVVERGIVQQNAARFPDDPTKFGNIINNGRYSSSLDIFGLALQARFWAGRKARARA
jgi:long-subunit fatty acid transport protein